MFTRKTLVGLRWFCRCLIAVAGLSSVWANILHVTVPSGPAIAFAAAPPLIVVAGWEMVSRIPIRENAPWYVKLIRPTITGLIAFGGAWLSYWHQRAAIERYNGGDLTNAAILPLLIDGLMIIASVSVYELNHRIRAMDARKEAFEQLQASKAQVVQEQTQQKPLNGKERIAVAMTELPPWATVKEIAERAKTSEAYTATEVSKLRRAQRTNGHTAPAMAN